MSTDFSFNSTSDGWRGVIAKDFTYKSVYELINAISSYVLKHNLDKKIVLGYDTRFMSKNFANYAAALLNDNGIACYMLSDYSTTPLLSFATNYLDAPLGINITASHNPPIYNGIKIRMNYGGAADKEVIRNIECNIKHDLKKVPAFSKIEYLDPIPPYINKIERIITLSELENNNKKVIVDSMHGTTRNLLSRILIQTNIQVDYLHINVDPYFGGINPEPKYESTTVLQGLVKKGQYDIGFAHDGDGDRIVACVPRIGYLSPHDLAALLVLYLAKYKGIKGLVLGSSTLGRKTRMVCEDIGLTYKTIKVGFNNALKDMLGGNVLLAAEENGGIGFGLFLPERDATFAALLLLEANAKVGIAKLYKEVEQITGSSGFCRFNYKTSLDRKVLFQKIINKENEFQKIGKIKSVDHMDGLKITFINNDWISIRISGTEDILRIYCESSSRDKATDIKNTIVSLIKRLNK